MVRNKDIRERRPERPDPASGEGVRLGVYRPGFRFRKESLAYFRHCVGEETYHLAMNSDAGRAHHYVAARAFLSQPDWEKFVWIEEFGSLEGFPE